MATLSSCLIAEAGEGPSAPGGQQQQPQGPFEVTLQYSGPAVLLWLWSNAHSSEDTGLKAHSIKHTAGNTGDLSTHEVLCLTIDLSEALGRHWADMTCACHACKVQAAVHRRGSSSIASIL